MRLAQEGCNTLLQLPSRLREHLSTFGDEVRIFGPSRFFLAPRDTPPEHLPFNGFLTDYDKYKSENTALLRAIAYSYQFLGRRAIGLFRGERGHLYDCVHGDRNYVLTVTNGIFHCLDRGLYRLTSRPNATGNNTWGKPRVASLLTKLALGIAVGVASAPYMNAAIEYPFSIAKVELQYHYLEKYFDFYYLTLKYDPSLKLLRARILESWPASKSEQVRLQTAALNEVRVLDNDLRSFLGIYSPQALDRLPELAEQALQSRALLRLRDNPKFAEMSPKDRRPLLKDLVGLAWLRLALTYSANDLLKAPEKARVLAQDHPQFLTELEGLLKSSFYQTLMVDMNSSSPKASLSEVEATALLKTWIYYRFQVREMELLNVPLPENFSFDRLEQELLEDGHHDKNLWDLPGSIEEWRNAVRKP